MPLAYSKNMDEKSKKKKESPPPPYSFFVSRIVEKICLGIIQWGTYLILFTPLIISGKFFFPFVGPKSLYFMALVEIVFAAYLFLAISLPKYRPKFNILLVAIILFMVILVLSTVFGADFSRSFWSKYERMGGLLMWSHLFAFFVATFSTFQKKDWLRVFEISIMVAIFVSILAILTERGIGPLVKTGFETRQGATLGNSSFLASYLLFNVFLALYLFLIKTRKEAKIFFGASFAFITITLFLSTGRAATLAFIGGIILLFFLKLIFCEKGSLRLAGILLLIIFLVGGILIIFSSLEPEENVIQRVMAEKFSIGLGKDRPLVWSVGLKGWRERPWLGWGLENFNLVFTKNFDSRIFISEIYGSDIWYDRAHNIVVDTLVANGILGFLTYLGIFGSTLYILWKGYLSQKIEFITAGLFSVVLFSYFLQNLTVFDMVSSFMMFFLVLGFVGSIASPKDSDLESSEEKAFFFKPWIIPVILILFILSFFYFIVQPLRSNYYLIVGFRTADSGKRFALYEKSLEISPLGKDQIREAIANRELPKYTQREIVETIPLETQKQELDFLSQELEKNIKESPLLFSSYLTLGKVYNAYGRIDPSKFNQAQEVLEKSIEVSPGNQQGYWTLAQTKLFLGKFDEAISILEKAVELEPRVERSSMILIDAAAVVSSLTGDDDLLKEKIEMVLKINPDWATDVQWILEQRMSGS